MYVAHEAEVTAEKLDPSFEAIAKSVVLATYARLDEGVACPLCELCGFGEVKRCPIFMISTGAISDLTRMVCLRAWAANQDPVVASSVALRDLEAIAKACVVQAIDRIEKTRICPFCQMRGDKAERIYPIHNRICPLTTTVGWYAGDSGSREDIERWSGVRADPHRDPRALHRLRAWAER